MTIRGTTRLLGILGHPLSHSYSPAMHNAGIESLGLDLAYLPFPVEGNGLAPVLNALKSVGFLGVNVTMPHKSAVLPLLDEVSPISRTMGVVNTIVNRDGKLYGTTTDPDGFLRAYQEAEGKTAGDGSFDGKSVAILGNGGSARTIAFTLALMTKARRTAVVARDPVKSAALIAEIGAAAPGAAIRALTFAAYADAEVRAEYDVVVNTTPLGMDPEAGQSPLPAAQLEPGQTVYDIIYNPEETVLLREAKARGCRTIGGLGMLVHQGLASFELWTGRNPGSAAFYAGIRRQRELRAGSAA
jgi:shikimate dehydrogenase